MLSVESEIENLKKENAKLKKQLNTLSNNYRDEVHCILSQISSSVVTVDLDEKILYMNNTPKGTTLESFIGVHIYEFVPKEQHHITRKSLQYVKETLTHTSYEIKILVPNNIGKRDYSVTVGPLFKDNELSGYVFVSNDITDQKENERQANLAREKNNSLERLANITEITASIAHEVNQPISAIVNCSRGCSNLLKKDGISKTKLLEMFENITSLGLKAGNIVHHIRSLILDTPIERKHICVNQLLVDIIYNLDQSLTSNNIEIDLNLSQSPLLACIDEIQIQQVLNNVIKNAIQEIRRTNPERRKISIRTLSKGDESHVYIRDYGSGIDDAIKEKIFEPFFTTKKSGIGIGLSLCRTIMMKHDGQISLLDTKDGAEFLISLCADC